MHVCVRVWSVGQWEQGAAQQGQQSQGACVRVRVELSGSLCVRVTLCLRSSIQCSSAEPASRMPAVC